MSVLLIIAKVQACFRHEDFLLRSLNDESVNGFLLAGQRVAPVCPYRHEALFCDRKRWLTSFFDRSHDRCQSRLSMFLRISVAFDCNCKGELHVFAKLLHRRGSLEANL
jgi:hypothetical protein